MIRSMRTDYKSLTKFFMWAAAAALVGTTFLVWGVRSGSDRDAPDVVAKVGKDSVSIDEYQRAYQQYMDYLRRMFQGNVPSGAGWRIQVLQELIQRRLLIREAERLKLTVSSQEIAEKIKTYDAFKDNGTFSRERYIQVLKMNRLTPERFEQQMREDLQMKKMNDFMEDQARVSDAEAEDNYRRNQEKIKVEYVFVPASLGQNFDLSEAEMKKYYDEHKDSYMDKERVDFQMTLLPARNMIRARHILFKVEDPPKPGQDRAAKALAEETLKKIKAGEDFEKLARELSQDPGSAKEGGDLNYFPRGRMVKPFDDAAFALKPGEVSGVVQSPFGYHIIKVEETLNSPVGDIADPNDAQSAAKKRAEELQKKAKKSGLDKAADSWGLKVREVKDFARGDKLPAFGFAPLVERTVFSLKKGEVSRAVQGPLGFYIIKLIDKKDPQPQPYEKATAQVKKDLSRQKALEESKARAAALAAKIPDPAQWERVLRQEKVSSTKTDFFVRSSQLPGVNNLEAFTQAAFVLKKGEVSAPVRTADGYYLIKLMDRQDIDPEKFAQEKVALKTTLLNQKKEKIKRAYLEDLKKKAKVEVFEERLPAATEG